MLTKMLLVATPDPRQSGNIPAYSWDGMPSDASAAIVLAHKLTYSAAGLLLHLSDW